MNNSSVIMEAGDRLNIAFVETTLNMSMLAEVDDLDTTFADGDNDTLRSNGRCSTPNPESEDQVENSPSFDVSNVDAIERAKVSDVCEAVAAMSLKSQQ